MHPDQYPEEVQYLADTVAFIDDEIRRLNECGPATAPYKETAAEIQRLDDKKLEGYLTIRPRPYLARLDFLQDGRTRPDKRYIGTINVPRRVISWTTPIAEQLYYAEPTTVTGYLARSGPVRGG